MTLPNGLRVVLLRDPDAPVLSLCSTFDAGLRRDDPGAPGAARAVAELLRNGGRPLEGQDLDALLSRRGGVAERFVTHDAVTFCTTVPASELEFAVWFEAGRFGDYALTAEGRDRVVEELSGEFERLDDQAVGQRAPRRLRALAFQGRPSYARGDLPTSAQLEELELGTLKAFHREHYGARRAVVALVGDFDPAHAQKVLARHLGAAPAGQAPAPFDLELPHQTTERFSMIEDPASKVPAAFYGWVLPRVGDKHRRALELVGLALGSEARLGGSLVGPRKLAQSVEVRLAGHRGPELLSLHAVGTGPAALEGIQKAIDAELTKIAQFGLRPEELAAAEAALRQRRAEELASNLGKARALSAGVLEGREPAEVLDVAAGASSEVSNVELARAVREYLQTRRRTVIEVYPKGWADPWQTPMPVYHLVSAGETLLRIAAQHDTTVEVIAKMNNLDPKKPIYPGQNLKVPRSRATSVKAVVHTVRSGDTLTAIARKFNVTVQSLAEANGIDPKRPIRPGDELRIPTSKAATPAGAGKGTTTTEPQRTHTVRAGETLGGIALRYGVTTASLAAANGLGNKTTIRVGQTLKIPASTSASGPAPGGAKNTPSSATSAPKAAPVVHKVRGGDTLSGIAKKYGVSVDALARANRIDQKKPIRVGQQLVIPR